VKLFLRGGGECTGFTHQERNQQHTIEEKERCSNEEHTQKNPPLPLGEEGPGLLTHDTSQGGRTYPKDKNEGVTGTAFGIRSLADGVFHWKFRWDKQKKGFDKPWVNGRGGKRATHSGVRLYWFLMAVVKTCNWDRCNLFRSGRVEKEKGIGV